MKYHPIAAWITARSERKLLVVLLGAALASALVFLILATTMAERGVRADHEAAAHRIAGLFEASLKNAMLKRDLPGLHDIVRQLGSTPGVQKVLILNPDGEVRFSDRDERIGQRATQYLEGLCLHAGCVQSPAKLTWLDSGADGMRIAWPVRNEARCNACHGPVDQHPVNGILLIEVSAAAGSRAVQHATQPLLFAGLLAIALTAGSLVWALRRVVLRPLAHLTDVTDQLADGDLSKRAQLTGNDELARLSRAFDHLLSDLREKSDIEGYVTNLSRFLPEPSNEKKTHGGESRTTPTAPVTRAPDLATRVVLGIDCRALAKPVLRHRLITNFTADAEKATADDIIDELLKA